MQIIISKNNVNYYTPFERKSSTYGGLYEDELINLLEKLVSENYKIISLIKTETLDDRSNNYIIVAENGL